MVEDCIEPTRWDAKRLLEKWLEKRMFISLLVNCAVDYDGRAKSRLGYGDRSLVIKEDRTALVHQPKKRNPVNWMPPGSHCKLEMEDDELILRFSCINPREVMEVRVKQVYSMIAQKLVDGEELSVVGTEADVAEYINENPELIGDFQPANLEEQTKYGFIDVYGHDSEGTPVVVEVKRYRAGLSAVSQLRRYVERLKKKLGVLKVKGVIAAPGISDNAKEMLKDWNFKFKPVRIPDNLKPMNKGQEKLRKFMPGKNH